MSNYKTKLLSVNTFIFDYDGVMTDGVIVLNNEGEPLRTANVKDGYALQLLRKLGYNIAIISGGYSPSMQKRFDALSITDVFLGVSDKLQVYEKYRDDKGLSDAEIVYMGDDIPDYRAMKKCGLKACPADAVHEIQEISDYISAKDGGSGCVRDVVEQTLRAQNNWLRKEAFTW